jgi:hypothetical protein
MWMIHESGHIIACYILNIRIHWLMVFPGLGALLRAMDGAFHDQKKEAMVGIAGPTAGFVGTFIAYVVFLLIDEFDQDVARKVLNVFAFSCVYNALQLLITTRPFDGGRVTQIIHPSFRVFGWATLVLMTAFFMETWVIAFWVLAINDVRFRFAWRRLFAIFLLSVVLVAGIYLGYGRQVVFENASDVAIVLLALKWAIEEVVRDRKPLHTLPEWRATVIFLRRLSGSYVYRSDDRRGDTREIDGRRIHDGVVVPKNKLPTRRLPQGHAERRGTRNDHHKLMWVLIWVGHIVLFVALFGILVMRA